LNLTSFPATVFTLKAKTFHQGKESRVAIAKFKIARIQLVNADNDVENALPH